jgi:hypothetical protein
MLELDAAGNILYKVKDYKLHIGEVSLFWHCSEEFLAYAC